MRLWFEVFMCEFCLQCFDAVGWAAGSTVSCFSKFQIGLAFLVPAHLGSPGKRAVKCEFVEWHYSMWLYFVAVMCLWLSPPVDRAGGIVFRVISPSVCTCMQGSRYSPLGLPWLLFSVMFLICKTGRVKIIKLWRVKNNSNVACVVHKSTSLL